MNVIQPTISELEITSNSVYKKRENSNKINYLNKEYIKPWGREFLVYQTEKIGIWILYINKNKKTSLHCHFKKNTLLIVMSGCFRIDLYDRYVLLNECDTLYIPANVFHGLMSYDDNCVIMEIEVYNNDVTYSDKNDLFRLTDVYNRDKNSYAGSVVEVLLDECNSVNFHTKTKFYFGDTNIYIKDLVSKCDLSILLDGCVYNNNVLNAGSIIDKNYYLGKQCESLFMNITNNYIRENKKIICSKEHLKDLIEINRFAGIGLTSGCFDILHVGHIHNLKLCKLNCKTFFVCLSSDKQIKTLKGHNRPVNSLSDRLRLLTSLNFIDYVILYDEINNESEIELDNIINILNPDTWFKGNDYDVKNIISKHPSIKKVMLFDNVLNKSTTNTIKQILLEN